MGRSVSYPANAVVAFDHFVYGEDAFDNADDWRWYVDDLTAQAEALFPSMDEDKGWLGREDRILASNRFCHFGVSEYCGLVAIWIVARDDCESPELAEAWLRRVTPKFLKTFGTLTLIGRASNGEAFFQRIGV